jgi:ApaG protein
MRRFFHALTNQIRVTVRPAFAPEHSDPSAARFVFTYHIRIENVGDQTVQLLTRHWHIHDSIAGDSQVEGEGVVGERPVIAPGDVHEYESFCVLQGASGHMQGYYRFRQVDGNQIRVTIPRFELNAMA